MMYKVFFKSSETIGMAINSDDSAKKVSRLRMFFKVSFLMLLFNAGLCLNAQTTVSNLFSDHMVIQRDQPVKIWGWADNGTSINVTLSENSANTVSQNGKWEVELPAMRAGGPYDITIKAEATITISDVLVGDVWIAGGQSNMEWILKNTEDAELELTAANYPQIRFYKVPHTVSHTPNKQVPGGKWNVADPERAKIFSGVAWYFAKKNHLEKGVPVGILESNYGGTPAESWLSLDAISSVASYAEDVATIKDPQKDWGAILVQNELNDKLRFEVIADTDVAMATGAHVLDLDDSAWESVQIPNKKPILDFVWLRKTLNLKGTERNVKLNVGKMETRGQLFFNGELMYSKKTTKVKIISIPTELIREGKNVITCRLANSYGGKTYFGDRDNTWIEMEGTRLSLEGEWKYSNTIESPLPEVQDYKYLPSFLYNGMIAPIINFNARGIIWYQGESNALRANEYNTLFTTLIKDWRDGWQKPDMPFLFVQLANFQARKEQPSNHDWAYLREAQTQSLAIENTGMTTTIDIGDANDIHPRNKKDVGERLWGNARKVSFGDANVSSGPMYQSHKILNKTITISFDYASGGLQTINDAVPVGFAIAGADKIFYWADAQIQGDQIHLTADEVSTPVAVRYAWAVNPATNLYNKEGLPAIPFRTDDWN